MKRIGNELANLDEQLLCDLVNIVKIYTWKISDWHTDGLTYCQCHKVLNKK